MSFAWPRRSCICVAASCVPSQVSNDNGHHARCPARADDHYAPGRSGVFIVRPQMMTAENPHSNTAVITDRDAERWVQHPHNLAHRQRTSLALGAGDQMHAPRGHGPEFEGPFVQFHPWTSSGHRSVSAAVDAPWQATQTAEPPSMAVRPVFLSNLELGRVDVADRFDLRSRLQGYVTVTEPLSSDGPAFYSTSCTMPSSAPGADIVTTTATGVARHSKSGAPKRTQPRFARHAKPAKANRSVTTNSWAPVRILPTVELYRLPMRVSPTPSIQSSVRRVGLVPHLVDSLSRLLPDLLYRLILLVSALVAHGPSKVRPTVGHAQIVDRIAQRSK